MKKIITALAAITAFGIVAAPSSATAADVNGKISKSEFSKIDDNYAYDMTRGEMHKRFDVKPEGGSSYGRTLVRVYDAYDGGTVEAQYEKIDGAYRLAFTKYFPSDYAG